MCVLHDCKASKERTSPHMGHGLPLTSQLPADFARPRWHAPRRGDLSSSEPEEIWSFFFWGGVLGVTVLGARFCGGSADLSWAAKVLGVCVFFFSRFLLGAGGLRIVLFPLVQGEASLFLACFFLFFLFLVAGGGVLFCFSGGAGAGKTGNRRLFAKPYRLRTATSRKRIKHYVGIARQTWFPEERHPWSRCFYRVMVSSVGSGFRGDVHARKGSYGWSIGCDIAAKENWNR